MRDIGVRYHEQLLAGDSSAAEPMLHWLRKAAETGFASSRKMLASLLLDGNGVPADLEHLLTEQIKNDGLNDAFGNDIEV